MNKDKSNWKDGRAITSTYTKEKDNYKQKGFSAKSTEAMSGLRESIRKVIKDWQYEAYTVRRLPDASLISLITKLEDFCKKGGMS